MRTLLVIISLVIGFQLSAQATKQRATLYFKNGEVKKAYARISGYNVRYSDKAFKGKEKKVNYKELDHIELRNGDKLIHVYYKQVKGKKKPRLMELIVDGKAKLYRILDVYDGAQMLPFKNMRNNKNYSGEKNLNTRYFLESKDGDGTVFRIKKNFEKEAKKYFSDCEKLVKLIGTKGFRKKDLLDIVLFYNEECEETE